MGRLVIVSNRVGSPHNSNEGGLATAMLAALGDHEGLWLGWSGATTEAAPGATRVLREGRLTRLLIDLQRSDYERYYVGFSNRVLWPLFHYRIDLAGYDREDADAYWRVNDFFAERLAAALEPDDTVWIHDYHLIPLGTALRRLGIRNRLGFFLHVPFPVPEVLTTLPAHHRLVQALFAYDLVGFQTDTDVRAFTGYIECEAEGWRGGNGTVHAFGTSLRIAAFPIGIDTGLVAARAARAAATGQATRLRGSLSGRQLIIGVDRLDYSKGLIHRFAAVDRLLSARPQHRRAIVMLQIAPTTREDVPEYQQIRAELDAAIGRINGRFGEPDVFPVRYINRHFRQETLFGFYRASRVALVTPLRDGMNLVAKEFVAAQDPEDPGVLVLSRFAGAARELEAALIVNPFDTDQTADALDRALTMSVEERRLRHGALMARLADYDIHTWRRNFLGALAAAPTTGGARDSEPVLWQ